MVWCLNCPPAPNAAYNTDPELLLGSVGKPAELPWSWWALDRSERSESLNSWEIKEQKLFHPKEYSLTNTLSARTYLPSLVLWRAGPEFASSSAEFSAEGSPVQVVSTSILSFAGRAPGFLECPVFCCWGAPALGHGLTLLLYMYIVLRAMPTMVLEQKCCVGGAKRLNIE